VQPRARRSRFGRGLGRRRSGHRMPSRGSEEAPQSCTGSNAPIARKRTGITLSAE
jgi:hypothetical protein